MNFRRRQHTMNIWLIVLMVASCNGNVKPNKKTGTTGNTAKEKEAIMPAEPIDKFEWKPITYDSTKQYIYLTFDDGPQNGTVACFELCKKLHVKATFFMVGEHVKSSNLKQIVHNIKEAYPEILLANHSTTHASGHYKYFYHHPEMALEDFYKAQETLSVPFKIIRLPGNSAWVADGKIKASGLVRPVCGKLDSSGYKVAGWDVEWSFNHKTENPVETPQKIASQVDSALARGHVHNQNHVVILSHDRMFRKPNYTDSLEKFITLLQQNPRFVFETIDHYPNIHP
ncbi:polysaccharide deacetylase family protein [Parasediminibacterium sp. JCM 36343]|uniref:polysaccharide deacetylase family protein n=1 Tax=Parasediminibacterium sp. JCM 36343 TaxID=3374279 RepID=UPI00397CF7E3